MNSDLPYINYTSSHKKNQDTKQVKNNSFTINDNNIFLQDLKKIGIEDINEIEFAVLKGKRLVCIKK